MKLVVAIAMAVLAGQQPEALRFVTCPVYRDTDTGRKSGCWLAEDRTTGRRWDVTQAPSKPDWNHEVLVEGLVAPVATTAPATPADAQPCGAPVLDPVRTSVLPGACTRQMLPAEGFAGRKFTLPARNVAPMAVPRKVPPGPYAARTFHLFFDLNQAFVIYQYDDYLLDQAITWIRAAHPRAITVTGWAAVDAPPASGRAIAEAPAIARTRAERITEALVRLGVDKAIITTRWRTDPAPIDVPAADGLAEPSRRRVDIAVMP